MTLAKRAHDLSPKGPLAMLAGVWPVLAILLTAVVAQLWLKPFMVSQGWDFAAKILLDVGVNVILAVSLTMVNGFTGQFSMGHAAFMLVGGYVAAAIVYYGSFRIWGDADLHGGLLSSMLVGREASIATGADLLFLGAIIAGGLVAAFFGLLVGLPSVRLRGDYLAIVTLGFGEIVRVVVQRTDEALYDPETIAATPLYALPKYVGGALGFPGLPTYTGFFWVVLVGGLTLLVAYRLKSSTHGRAMLSIREDEIAAEAMGVPTTRYKVKAFVISAFFAGCAGALFAHTVGVILNPAELGFQKSFDIIIMVVLGGLGSISGATLAAAGLTYLPELLRHPQDILRVWPYALALTVVGLGLRRAMKANQSAAGNVAGRVASVLTFLGLLGLGLAGLAGLAVWRNIDLSQYRMVLYALALILIMILRPSGLLGVHEVWDKNLWTGGAKRKR